MKKDGWFQSEAKLMLAFCLLPVVTGFAAAVIMPNFMRASCENRVIEEILSPDGSCKAVIFARDCGARKISSEISILPADDNLPNKSGNIFTADTEAPVKVVWQDETHFRILYASGINSSCQQDAIADVNVSCGENVNSPPKGYKIYRLKSSFSEMPDSCCRT